MVNQWSYCGIEINDHSPHLAYYPDTNEVAISLSERVKNDDIQLIFQLAHEVCHLLYPTMDIVTKDIEKTTILNEGVSTYFSILIVAKFSDVTEIIIDLKKRNFNYFEAYSLVSELMDFDLEAIKKLREHEPYLNKIEARHFELATVNISEALINKLLCEFQ